jgi:hypothetical protein
VVVLLTNKERNMSPNIQDARSIVFELAALALTDKPITEDVYEAVMLRRRELLQFLDHQDQMLHGRRDPLLDDPHP